MKRRLALIFFIITFVWTVHEKPLWAQLPAGPVTGQTGSSIFEFQHRYNLVDLLATCGAAKPKFFYWQRSIKICSRSSTNIA